tara:strand:+ start:1440 stop:3227 length:1788 start_codon:yes stop_codon:yes gene_type:complete
MITVTDLGVEKIRAAGGADFKVAMMGLGGFGQWQYGYLVASDENYRLYYTILSGQITLKSGAVISAGNGFLIAETVPNKPYVLGLAWFPFMGESYADATDDYKEEVVAAYNSTILGSVVETTEDVEAEPILNDRGETYGEQKAREEREAAEAEAQALEDSRTAVNTQIVIRAWSETLTSKYESGNLTMNARVELVEITTGTVANPQVSYRIDEINTGAEIESLRIKTSLTADTQEEAEAIFDSVVSNIESDFNMRAEESNQLALANRTTTEKFDSVEVFFQESPLSFENMLMEGDNYEFDETAFRNARSNEVGGARKGGLFRGPYGDAASFSNGGNTLNLDDFDTPRITTEGITENKSGAVAFTIKKGWKVTFNLSIDDYATFINDAADENDSISRDGNSFDFTMYGGDRLEIDIDNERSGIYPFLVTSQGRKWSSIEEIDDEVSLTMVKAEQLRFTAVYGERTIYEQSGELISETADTELEGPVSFTNGPLTESSNLMINSEVNALVNANPEYQESLTYTRDLIITDVEPEGSFVSPEDITEDITDAVGGVWDSIKWWVLGGVIAVVVVGILVVYVNGRSRSTQVVQAAPVSEA